MVVVMVVVVAAAAAVLMTVMAALALLWLRRIRRRLRAVASCPLTQNWPGLAMVAAVVEQRRQRWRAAPHGEALIWMRWPCLPTADITAAEQERERAVGEGTKGVEMRLSFDTAKPHGIAAPAGLMSLASGKSAFGPAIHRTHRVCRARAWRDVFCPHPSLLCRR
jgi:hypothetical protein